MPYYNTCPRCGSNLDPGERCECEREQRKNQDFFGRHLKTEARAGQLAFVFESKEAGHEKKMFG